jgi:hypothetical protein
LPYTSEHAARQLDPKQFKRFVRTSRNFPKGVSAIIGWLSNGKSKIQSLRFDVKYWTAEQARRWLNRHGYKSNIEEATSKNVNWRDVL